MLSSRIPPSNGINISGVNPSIEINPVAVPVTITGIPPSSSKAKYIALSAKIAKEAIAMFINITGKKEGKPGKKAKIKNDMIRRTNKTTTDLAMPTLSETKPAIKAEGGLMTILPMLIAPAAITLNEKISVE
tara:strand:+ start:372 stop:767 length:396 start_codon:yes stop_codon:yes gene_type:complete